MIRGVESVDAGSEHAYSVVANSLIDSSFLPTLLSSLHEAYEANLGTGPLKRSASISGVVETDYLSVLARLALANPKIFISTVVASAEHAPEGQTFHWLLTEWFAHFDNMGDINRKKLHALALTRLLSVNGPSTPAPDYLLNNLTVIPRHLDGSYHRTRRRIRLRSDPRRGDYLIFWNGEPNENSNDKYQANETPETARRRAWAGPTPCTKSNPSRDFVAETLRGVVNACGGIDEFQNTWLINVMGGR